MLFGKLWKPCRFIAFRKPLRALRFQHILSLWKDLQVVAGE
jgi:hypothetical protein